MALPSLKNFDVSGKDLPYEDSIPMESSWHLDAMYLLIRILEYFWRDRDDVYLGGNMFVYFDPDQIKSRNFRGPDFFVVKGVPDTRPRNSWVVWEEDGLAPNFVVELASPSTADFDISGKKDIYEQMLETPEYIVYDPTTETLQGWRLVAGNYGAIKPNDQGWLWSQELELWIGVTEHQFLKYPDPVNVLRFFDATGKLILAEEEAESQARRDAEQEIERLKRLLGQ